MGIVSIVLLVLFVIACLLLVLVVLIQDEQGEGLGGLFGGGGTSFGPRTGNVLTKFTSILGVAFLVGAFAVAWLNRTPEIGDVAGKARLEQAGSGSQADWWVETGSLESGASDTTGSSPTDSSAAASPAESQDSGSAAEQTQGGSSGAP